MRKRVVTSKPSRDGCKTCRLRRVKCDETRPQCIKCRSGGQDCDYEARLLTSSSNHASRKLLPQPQQRQSPLVISCSYTGGPRDFSPNTPELTCISSFANAADRRAYDFFLQISLEGISSSSPMDTGWLHLAIQQSRIKPVFHAIAAVGKAHASIRRIFHVTLVRSVHPTDLEAALLHYGKALSALQEYINDVVERGAAVVPVLLASLLLTCHDVLTDRKRPAWSHYLLGRRLLNRSSTLAAGDQSEVPSLCKATRECLAPAFQSLGHAGGYYWIQSEKSTSPVLSSVQSRISHPASALFTSFVEADMYLQKIVELGEEARSGILQLAQAHVNRVHGEYLDPAISFCLVNCLSKSIDISMSLQQRLENATQAHVRWLQMLQLFISQQRKPISDHIFLLTQIRYFASWLIIDTCRETSEILIDRFEPEFVRILDLIESYFRYIAGRTQPVRPPQLRQPGGLSLEGEILTALHLIVCKSRSSAIRRRAAKILIEANREVGTWHSQVIGPTVSYAAKLEEVRARALLLQSDPQAELRDLTSEQVPEEARFADSVVEGGPGSTPFFKLVCARYMHDVSGRIEIMEYRGEGFPVDPRFVGSRVYDCSVRPS